MALKVISMNAEEGVPFTAIREGKYNKNRLLLERAFISTRFGKIKKYIDSLQHQAFAFSKSKEKCYSYHIANCTYTILLCLFLGKLRFK